MTLARLRPDCKRYPELKRERWYRVRREDELGYFLDLERRTWSGKVERWVLREHVEVRDG